MKLLDRCPACDSHFIKPDYVTAKDTFGRTWQVYACQNCGHGFVNPQPNWDELADYYGETYRPYATSHAADGSDEQTVSEARKTGQLRHAPIRRGDRVLDIGCGGGYFLRLASRLGAIVEGIEPSPIGVERAREQGLTVFQGTVSQYVDNYRDRQFDLITANHVFEHLPQPSHELALVKSLLAANGKVVLAVPNAANWACVALREGWHSTDIPRHLMQFTEHSLRLCAEGAGLKVVEIKTASLLRGTIGSCTQWLRRHLFIPGRITACFYPVLRPALSRFSRRLDEQNKGEALIAVLSP